MIWQATLNAHTKSCFLLLAEVRRGAMHRGAMCLEAGIDSISNPNYHTMRYPSEETQQKSDI